jgi:hypothetical protein
VPELVEGPEGPEGPDQILVSEAGLCLGASFLLYVGHVYWLHAVKNADNRTKATIFFIFS